MSHKKDDNKIIKHLELKKIKELVEAGYGFSLNVKTRHRDGIYALKVFSQLARNRRHTYLSIADSVKKTHATILYHFNSFHTIEPYDLKIYNNCLEVMNDPSFGFNTTYDAVIIKEKNKTIKNLQKTVVELEHRLKEYNSNKKILEMFGGWSEEQKNDFIEYRLKPYSKLITVKNK